MAGSFHLPREVIVHEARAADLFVIGSHPAAGDTYHAFDPGSVCSPPAGRCWSLPAESPGSTPNTS